MTVLVILAAVGVWVLLGRRASPHRQIFLGPGLVGLAMVALSLFAWPWVQFGDPHCLERNAQWLAEQIQWIEGLRSYEPFTSLLQNVSSGAEILSNFDREEDRVILAAYHQSGFLTGWQVGRLAQPRVPIFSFVLLCGSLVCMLVVLSNAVRLVVHRNGPRGLWLALQGLLLVLLLAFITHLGIIDTLAARKEISLRILLSFLEARTGFGPYGLLLGWGLAVFSIGYDLSPESLSTEGIEAYDDWGS